MKAYLIVNHLTTNTTTVFISIVIIIVMIPFEIYTNFVCMVQIRSSLKNNILTSLLNLTSIYFHL